MTCAVDVEWISVARILIRFMRSEEFNENDDECDATRPLFNNLVNVSYLNF